MLLSRACATDLSSADSQTVHVMVAGEVLADVAIARGLGFVELVAANPGVDPWLEHPGRSLALPLKRLAPRADPVGLVINLPEFRAYLFAPAGTLVASLPVGIGREGADTPLGRTRVVRKALHPTWYVPADRLLEDPDQPPVVPPGPDNPLGSRALYLGWPRYLLHGSNRDYGIGRRVSSGCIRLYNKDVEWLYERMPIDTPVQVIDQPIKFGWLDGELWLEANPSLAQSDAIEAGGPMDPEDMPDSLAATLLMEAVVKGRSIDWSIVDRLVAERTGLPAPITKRD